MLYLCHVECMRYVCPGDFMCRVFQGGFLRYVFPEVSAPYMCEGLMRWVGQSFTLYVCPEGFKRYFRHVDFTRCVFHRRFMHVFHEGFMCCVCFGGYMHCVCPGDSRSYVCHGDFTRCVFHGGSMR
jgi:hypothetical protein